MNYNHLEEAGIDVKSLLDRLMGNESLVSRFLTKFIEDTNITKLTEAVREKNPEDMLSASHMLKGMTGNLSITPLYSLFSKQVELIRGGDLQGACDLMPEISRTYNKAAEGIKLWLNR